MSKHTSGAALPSPVADEPRNVADRNVDDRAPEPIDPAHRAAVSAGLADMRAGRLAAAAEIEALYARFGRGSR